MTVLFSEDVPQLGWSEAHGYSASFGPKGAMLLTLPRSWTPPFALIPADAPQDVMNFVPRIKTLTEEAGQLIVRSSVVGESIWDRGSYKSVISAAVPDVFEERLSAAVELVIRSAPGKAVALVVQRYVKPLARGEFGNLLRISKTRDHWELSTESGDARSSVKFNTQRDEAASPDAPLRNRPSISRERLFGSVAAWLNNMLLRGRRQRLNCEWVADGENVYIVQLDEEDEDHVGVNPFQVRVVPTRRPAAAKGAFLAHAEGDALKSWDKLKVLDELWEPDSSHKPTLFFVPLVDLRGEHLLESLTEDFRNLVGPSNIVVRTSVRAGKHKPPNLPRTEGLNPERAAAWCRDERDRYRAQGVSLEDYAFVTHQFVPARASAWARAEPRNPMVDIHSLWGLPDGLQSCPYDIWEVHVPTGIATEYPEYKSNMLLARDDGGWEYVRVKNELGRNLSVTQREALDIAKRTLAIAERLGKGCHIMWFVGCVDEEGTRFNIPWYWNEAHETKPNTDRTNYETIIVSDPASLRAFEERNGSRRQAIQFRPVAQDLMRDSDFITAVGAAAKSAGVPVILQGSTLAHAYYQLTRTGCTVVATGEREHSRVRRPATFGKLVRDKIPARIAARSEAETTLKLPNELVKGFLIGKLIEEAMEVRHAETPDIKAAELADLYEVVRALAYAEKVDLTEIITRADEKKEKTGGFDGGIVLLQTGILGRDQKPSRKALGVPKSSEQGSQVLARKIGDDAYEIPFSFFGFMENGLTRSLVLEGVKARLDVTLKTDRIVIAVVKNAEQLEFPLDLTVGPID